MALELSRYCIPFTPFRGSLTDAVVALVTTAGVYPKADRPFDVEGDKGFRAIPGAATRSDLAYADAHYDHGCVDRDLNCVFPLDRLRELAAEGLIGGVAERHFSMGFSPELRALREETIPALVAELSKVRPAAVLLTGG